jgi:hypothetical protein
VWHTLVDGPVKNGCAKKDESIAVSAVCKIFRHENFEYRTKGIYTVVWADGDITVRVLLAPVVSFWAC